MEVEGDIESGGRGRNTITHTVIGSIGELGTTAFYGHHKITLNGGQQMLIRITRP